MMFKRKWWEILGHAALAAALVVFLMTGCGPSFEERQAKEQKEREEKLQKEHLERQQRISNLARRFDAVYFPPQTIKTIEFTYKIQKFFEAHAGEHIAFEAYLEDVLASKGNIYVEFLRPIGEPYFPTNMVVRFRLSISKDHASEFLDVKPNDPLLSDLRFFSNPDYVVIAEIMDVQKLRVYEFDESGYSEEIELELDESRSVMAAGRLVWAAPLPEGE